MKLRDDASNGSLIGSLLVVAASSASDCSPLAVGDGPVRGRRKIQTCQAYLGTYVLSQLEHCFLHTRVALRKEGLQKDLLQQLGSSMLEHLKSLRCWSDGLKLAQNPPSVDSATSCVAEDSPPAGARVFVVWC